MCEKLGKSLKIISMFSINKASGHSVYDDLFYYGIIKKSRQSFTFFAPPYSIAQLAKRYTLNKEDVSPISVEERGWIATVKAIFSIPVSQNSKVIFLGYSEKFVFLFFLINI